MGQGRHRRPALHEGRCAWRSACSTCMKRGFDLLRRAQGHRPRSRDHPGRGPAHLRDDPQGRHARHVPDRKPRADVDAAAPQAAHLLRSRHRGGDRPAGPDPGRHGASLSAPPRGQGGGRSIPSPNWSRCWERRSACRCSRSRRCGSPSSAPASRPARPTSCAARMATFKYTGGVSAFRDKLIAGMVAQRL